MNFKTVPWKRNIQIIPDALRKSLDAIPSDLVRVAATKRIALRDVAVGLYEPIGLALIDGLVVTKGPVLPPSNAGKWSTRNAAGWDRKRVDWPMVTKTYTFESPNFGDAAKFGSHMHVTEREVYQHQVFEPQGMQIEAEVLEAAQDDQLVVKFALSPVLSRGQPEFDLMLLWALNILQENTGTIGVFAEEAGRDDFIATIRLDWEVFPPGSVEEVMARLGQSPANPRNAPDYGDHVRDRIELFKRLKPIAYIRGQGGFGSYFGAQFADNVVAFENLKYGNALYILYEDWASVSKRSRLDLLRDRDAHFDRVTHGKDWQFRFLALIRLKMDQRHRKGTHLFKVDKPTPGSSTT